MSPKIRLWCPCGSDSKESACNAGDLGLIPGSGWSPGEGNGNPLQYSCLENFMDRGVVGYSPWGHKESDMTERLMHTVSICCMTQNPKPVHCDSLEGGVGWVGDRRELRRKAMYGYIWQIQVGVRWKPSQYCKVIILQLEVKLNWKKKLDRTVKNINLGIKIVKQKSQSCVFTHVFFFSWK